MKNLDQQKKKLEQKKARIALDETRLKLKERKMRTKALIQQGGLITKAGLDHLPTNSPYAKTLCSRKFTSSFIDAIFAATNNLYLIAK